jgi:hypothetical protein
VYFIDIDTNGEVDFSSTQLPFTALAWAAADFAPTAAITVKPLLEPVVDASAPFSRERQRATSAS